MMDFERRKIILDLNNLFSDYSYLQDLANFCDNDYEKIIKMISKVIKYSFVYSVTDTMGHLKNPLKVDSDYKRFLESNKKMFSFFKKRVELTSNFELDSDLRIGDLEGLVLPEVSVLVNICRTNMLKKEEENSKAKQMEELYKKAKGFDEVGLTYSTTELVEFNSNFVYYNSELTGRLGEDYYRLYNDERYTNNPNSPLKKSLRHNVEHIIKTNDIGITKLGDLHIISNGRHRILYLMYNDCHDKIPVSVTKRIEDKEFNIILLRLKEKYKMSFFKNNICNDEPDIMIVYNDKSYNIKNKNELIEFEKLVNNNQSLDDFYVSDFGYFNKKSENNMFQNLRNKIISFHLNNKDLNIFEGNYTDFLKLFDEENSNILYEAFLVNQKFYQRYKLFGIDFDDALATIFVGTDKDNNSSNKRR